MRTIVLTGGGTAGHVLPQMALLPYLKQKFENIIYIGGSGIEKTIATKYGLTYCEITTVKLRRTLTLKNLLIPIKLSKGIHEAKKILQQLKPDVIFFFFLFVALPVVIAASRLKIKVVHHESDMSLGLANRITAKYCQTLCTTFPLDKTKYPNMIQTGAIIRQNIYHGDAGKIKMPTNGKPNLLVMGGSLGATAINEFVWQNINQICTKWNIVHITGKGKSNTRYTHDNYYQVEYLDEPQDALAWSDIVLARSGSGTVSELLALKKPAIYIPLPKTESRGDQIQNAKYLHKLGVCEIIWQEELTESLLLKLLENVYQNRRKYIVNCEKQTWIDGTKKITDYLQ
ncbi:MAG: UDP-N-acetylglucosamine--N-acetylmuramyl-(pentapeptide) pyrophosphoryl-undecaprenol N-acetylglucosamine transferase [Clostridia bacterium]|nr:UDP-N-acetylglucosamine--N-acetylmuramyl-(pentapeptide) pyrophosphoryl-undecaprenol N-acetylglucosamine transferase [Clostridia bacterium]